jgi:hypothetical protein
MQNDATVQYHVPNTDLALQVLVATTSETDLNLRMRLDQCIRCSTHTSESELNTFGAIMLV